MQHSQLNIGINIKNTNVSKSKFQAKVLDFSKLCYVAQNSAAKHLSSIGLTEGSMAYTSRRVSDLVYEVALVMPLVNCDNQSLTKIKTHFFSEIPRYFPGSELGEKDVDPTADLQVGETSWEESRVYYHISDINRTTKSLTVKDWLFDNALSGHFDYNKRFCLWYKNINIKPKPAADPTRKPGKKDECLKAFNEAIEVETPIDQLLIPDTSFLTKYRKNAGITEREPQMEIFNDLVNRIIALGNKDENMWLDIGKILYKIPNSELEMWNNILMKVYTPEERESVILSYSDIKLIWYEFEKKDREGSLNYTIDTLMDYYYNLTQEGFALWHSRWTHEIMYKIYNSNNIKSNTIGILARTFSRLYRGIYKWSASELSWYHYDEVKKIWYPIKIAIEGAALTNGLGNAFLDLKVKLESDGESLKIKGLERLYQVSSNLEYSSGYRSSVLHEARNLMGVESLKDISDRDTDIIPLANLCLQVKTNAKSKPKLVFVPHKKENYFIRVASAFYDTKYSYDHPQVKEVINFLTIMFPNEGTRETMCYWIGSAFWRGNRDRLFFSIVGPGANGKTAFLKLLTEIFDEYLAILKHTVLYGMEKGSGAADPDIADLEGAALAVFSELEMGRTARTNLIKTITGGEDLKSRRLYQSERKIKPTAKIMIICNNLPHFPYDIAMQDRHYAVPAISRIDKDAPEDPVKQKELNYYKADPNFNIKLTELRDAACWLFVQYLKKYIDLGYVPISDEIKEQTEEYWKENNRYKTYIDENYERQPSAKIERIAMFRHAEKFFKRNGMAEEFARPKLIHYVEKMIGRYNVDEHLGYDAKSGIIYGLGLKEDS